MSSFKYCVWFDTATGLYKAGFTAEHEEHCLDVSTMLQALDWAAHFNRQGKAS
jgi:hypothetical protein